MAGLISLAQGLTSQSSDRPKSFAALVELERGTDAPGRIIRFQYFPESISDNKQANYQTKEIPGGSLPLYQWTSSGERSISFTAMFSCDVDLLAYSSAITDMAGDQSAQANSTSRRLQDRLKATGELRRNPDLRSIIATLRRYMLPRYSGKAPTGGPITQAPPKLRLWLPNSGIGLVGGDTTGSPDSITCVMQECSVTWQAYFQSGLPRLAEVSLSFAQIPQASGSVEFPHDSFELESEIDSESGSRTLGYPPSLLGRASR